MARALRGKGGMDAERRHRLRERADADPGRRPEVFGEDSLYRTCCTAKSRSGKGQCAWYTNMRPPWLAPGTAPVMSPCGVSSAAVDARNLPGNTKPAQWKAGSVVEVAWAIYANHGGGYQYRLCPLPASGNRMDLTESCFQKMPLRFAGPNVELQNAMNDTHAPRASAKALRVSSGTVPAGYEWAVNPVPIPDASGFPYDPLVPGACGFKGDKVTAECPYPVANWRIIDQLQVPGDLAPGRYVLSFRWDVENQVQVWSSCHDILVTKA